MQYVIAFDLGTGGLKAGLYEIDGMPIGFDFLPYETYFPEPGFHEQRPLDWWRAICYLTRKLIADHHVNPSSIVAIAGSGQSLVAAPISSEGELLLESVPIWSDRRAKMEAGSFFNRIDYNQWYLTTGNGDPPETYSIFKLMWLKKHLPDIYARTRFFLGSKDYINFRLTGHTVTDYSYASGCGAFELKNWRYNDNFIEAAGLNHELFPEIKDSFEVVGTVTAEAAAQCGLCPGIKVICGGVDNSCMALGTTGIGNGRAYTSLGSSAWIAVTAKLAMLNAEKLPFIFAHVEKGYYASAASIFSAANSYRWARDVFCADLVGDKFGQMDAMAAVSPVGANGVMFNPSLAGGSSQEPSTSLRGAFTGLSLSNNRGDILRAVLEGVALTLGCYCLPVIDPLIKQQNEMIICGGGAKSDLWMQIFADIFGRTVLRINVEQDAATHGAAAIAIRGAGLWRDYSPLDGGFRVQKKFEPIPGNQDRYAVVARDFSRWVTAMAALGEGTPAVNNN
jgi:xylulokinase